MQRRVAASYTPFYNRIALYPEIGRFRRFGAQWAKKLYDDTEDILTKMKAVDDALATARRSDSGVRVLDLPRSVVEKEHPEIFKMWVEYEETLTRYGQSLCLSEQVFKLPHQAPYAAKYLSKVKLFENNVFGPTGEAASVYQEASHRADCCAWRAPPESDILTMTLMNHGEWFEENLIGPIRRFFTCKKRIRQVNQTDIHHGTLKAIMDTIACIFVPLLLTGAMFTLADIDSLRIRIAVVGVFGLLFALCLKGISGHLTRDQVFTATAAFFAVASVFVGTTSSIGAGQ